MITLGLSDLPFLVQSRRRTILPPPPPGTIEFVSATYDIPEPAVNDTLIFYVKRTGGTYGISTVDFASSDITAITPTDYDGQSNTLTWTNGDDVNKPININVKHNNLVYFDAITPPPTIQPWYGMTVAPNGDVYAAAYGAGIYKQSGGVGSFVLIDNNRTDYYFMASTNTGDVYTTIQLGFGPGIFKQTGGAGSFVQISDSGQSWYGITINQNNNDMYATTATEIYKNAGSTGTFVLITPSSVPDIGWMHGGIRQIAVAPNGDLYLTVDYATAPINVMLNGGTAITEIVGSEGAWTGIAAAPNGDIYACQNGGTIWVKKSTNPGFTEITPNQVGAWVAMAVSSTGNVYADIYNGDIYVMRGVNKRFKINLSNVTNSDLGSIIESEGTIVKI